MCYVFSGFMGKMKFIDVTDVELLKKIIVKEHVKFQNRYVSLNTKLLTFFSSLTYIVVQDLLIIIILCHLVAAYLW